MAEVDWLRLRSSCVQIDVLSVQLTAAGSVLVIRSFPSGFSRIVQALFLSADCGFSRFASTMSASSSVKARSRTFASPVFTFSEKCSSKVNSEPSFSVGLPSKLAASGST